MLDLGLVYLLRNLARNGGHDALHRSRWYGLDTDCADSGHAHHCGTHRVYVDQLAARPRVVDRMLFRLRLVQLGACVRVNAFASKSLQPPLDTRRQMIQLAIAWHALDYELRDPCLGYAKHCSKERASYHHLHGIW